MAYRPDNSSNDVSNIDDINRLIKNYVEVPKHAWRNIELDSYIRYKTVDGILKSGGRIKKIVDDVNGGLFITLGSGGRTKKFIMWTINTDKVTNIYKLKPREPKKILSELEQTKPVPRNVALLDQLGERLLYDEQDNSKSLDLRVQKIEQDQKKIMNLIKKLYELQQARQIS
jgi:hypothetical protein